MIVQVSAEALAVIFVALGGFFVHMERRLSRIEGRLDILVNGCPLAMCPKAKPGPEKGERAHG